MWFLNVVAANSRRLIIELFRFLPNTIGMAVTFFLMFLLLFVGLKGVGDPHSIAQNTRFLMVADGFLFLITLAITRMTFEVTMEATRGTLEQLYMARAPVWTILTIRSVVSMGFNMLIVLLMLWLSMLITHQHLTLEPGLLLLLPPTLAGVMGIGFLLAGLSLVWKQTQSLLQVMQIGFMAMAFVPLSSAPFLQWVPVVKGIDMVRQITVYGRGFGEFHPSEWAVLLGTGAVYFTAGVGTFLFCERRAMNRGLLGAY